MAMQSPCTFIWVRIGDAADCQAFNGLEKAVEYLTGLGVGRVAYWRTGGVVTVNCGDHLSIALYRGDADAKLVSNLLPDERVVVEDGLRGCCDTSQHQAEEGHKLRFDRLGRSPEGQLLRIVESNLHSVYRKCG